MSNSAIWGDWPKSGVGKLSMYHYIGDLIGHYCPGHVFHGHNQIIMHTNALSMNDMSVIIMFDNQVLKKGFIGIQYERQSFYEFLMIISKIYSNAAIKVLQAL